MLVGVAACPVGRRVKAFPEKTGEDYPGVIECAGEPREWAAVHEIDTVRNDEVGRTGIAGG